LIPAEIRTQVDALVAGLEKILGGDLVGVYLHGSAVLGCFGPWSDIDLVAVSRRPTGLQAKRRLAALLLDVSGMQATPAPPHPVELDVVVESALRPWSYPTPFDFHYGESLRARFDAGELEPWEGTESYDLATHVTILTHAGIVLGGPPVEQVFSEVPQADYADALTRDLDWCRQRFAELPRYGVLSIARIWATLATGEPQSKATGADWALPRLPAELRPVLQHGLALYTDANETEGWDELPVSHYLECVAAEIDAVS
jgi:predicted nucleotidyltransferase